MEDDELEGGRYVSSICGIDADLDADCEHLFCCGDDLQMSGLADRAGCLSILEEIECYDDDLVSQVATDFLDTHEKQLPSLEAVQSDFWEGGGPVSGVYTVCLGPGHGVAPPRDSWGFTKCLGAIPAEAKERHRKELAEEEARREELSEFWAKGRNEQELALAKSTDALRQDISAYLGEPATPFLHKPPLILVAADGGVYAIECRQESDLAVTIRQLKEEGRRIVDNLHVRQRGGSRLEQLTSWDYWKDSDLVVFSDDKVVAEEVARVQYDFRRWALSS